MVTYLLPDHPHNSAEFFQHTGLKHYPKYMVGGGYIISDDVARLIVLSNQLVRPILVEAHSVTDAVTTLCPLTACAERALTSQRRSMHCFQADITHPEASPRLVQESS